MQTVLGARQRLGVLYGAMAEAGLWSAGAEAALAALWRGLTQQHQLYVAYLELARHAVQLPVPQQQVPTRPPPSSQLWRLCPSAAVVQQLISCFRRRIKECWVSGARSNAESEALGPHSAAAPLFKRL